MFEAIRTIDWDEILPPMPPGSVTLIGAGPGGPLLISLRGAIRMMQADTIIYDALVDEAALGWAAPTAERIYVGKRAGAHKMPQEQINETLIERARAGRRVARLKGGDPLVFGRGSEEAEALRLAGIGFEIVPGITAASGAAAYAGIPLTDRRFASTLAFVTGHEDPTKPGSAVDYAALARTGSVVLYMGLRNLAKHTDALIQAGMSPDTPAAVVSHATLPQQRCVVGTLRQIASLAESAGLPAPALTLIGGAIELRDRINWFEQLPLFGKTIAVTRSRHQASKLAAKLTALGAKVLEAATIEIAAADEHPIREALRNVRQYDWLILTSVNGVDAFVENMQKLGLDGRALGGLKIGAIGVSTGEAIRRHFLQPDVVPDEFKAEALAEALSKTDDFAGKKVLLFRADIARPALREALSRLGAECHEVCAYRIVRPPEPPRDLLEALDEGRLDWITFTSSSTFRNLIEMLGGSGAEMLKNVKLASIGPITSETIRAAGLEPAVEASPYTIAGLVEAIVRYEKQTR